MLYSFNIKEPHHARGHAYARTTAAGISYTLLFVVKVVMRHAFLVPFRFRGSTVLRSFSRAPLPSPFFRPLHVAAGWAPGTNHFRKLFREQVRESAAPAARFIGDGRSIFGELAKRRSIGRECERPRIIFGQVWI